MTQLPDIASQLILLALHDLELTEADPEYEVVMEEWHAPSFGYCAVCFAGAVMAKSLGAVPHVGISPSAYPDDNHKLHALDYFREGSVHDGMRQMGFKGVCPVEDFEFDITTYSEDPEYFKADMRNLAKRLERHGL
jgi:hypothetical protein